MRIFKSFGVWALRCRRCRRRTGDLAASVGELKLSGWTLIFLDLLDQNARVCLRLLLFCKQKERRKKGEKKKKKPHRRVRCLQSQRLSPFWRRGNKASQFERFRPPPRFLAYNSFIMRKFRIIATRDRRFKTNYASETASFRTPVAAPTSRFLAGESR